MDLELQRFETLKDKFGQFFKIINANVTEATQKFNDSTNNLNKALKYLQGQISKDDFVNSVVNTAKEDKTKKTKVGCELSINRTQDSDQAILD